MTAVDLPENVQIGVLARILGVTTRQARNQLETAGVKAVAWGQWPLAGSIRAIVAKAREAKEPDALAAARARAINAKARQTEIALARAERDLIPLEDAIAGMDELVGVTREVLIGLPARITRDLDLRRKIEAEVHAGQLRIVKKMNSAAAALRDAHDGDEGEAA